MHLHLERSWFAKSFFHDGGLPERSLSSLTLCNPKHKLHSLAPDNGVAVACHPKDELRSSLFNNDVRVARHPKDELGPRNVVRNKYGLTTEKTSRNDDGNIEERVAGPNAGQEDPNIIQTDPKYDPDMTSQ